MDVPIDDAYLEWLYDQVGSVEVTNPARTYWNILRQLYTKEFVWHVPNDDNRVEDGRDLRREFLEEQKILLQDPHWLDLGCSMLELLIGLSRRLSFEAEGEPSEWFWHLMENIHLDKYNDRMRYDEEKVDEILERIIWRTYKANGRGGLFPLERPAENQTRVELWYQMSAYLLERG